MIDPCIVYSSILVLSDTMIFAASLLLDRAACSWRSNPCFYCCCLLMVWWYFFLLEEEADERR